MKEAGQKMKHKGKCRENKPCACPKILRPVCADGQTFNNACLANCAGFSDYTQGKCQ